MITFQMKSNRSLNTKCSSVVRVSSDEKFLRNNRLFQMKTECVVTGLMVFKNEVNEKISFMFEIEYI